MKALIIKITFLLVIIFGLNSCDNKVEINGEVITSEVYICPMRCEGDKTYDEHITCPVCKMDLKLVEENKELNENEIASESIFNLTSKWTNQHNKTIELKDLKGDVLVVVMIYTSCQAACPRLVADMRNIYEKVDNKTVKYVLVSIDPETDTPEKMNAFAKENQLNNNQWILLRSTVDNTREFSNVLAVKYKEISPIDFSHSNIISVFDKNGVLYHQQEGLGVDNKETVSKVIQLVE